MKKNINFYFFGLFTLISILFSNGFKINFFQDDFLFLKLSKINSIAELLSFYNPFRSYSYKPLASETFYFILRLLNYNVVLGHVLVYLTFFIGLIFLFFIIKKVTKSFSIASLSCFFYGIHFIHIFQLYWFATYQEILAFTLISASFYFYLNNKNKISIFTFILSLLCKETAVLYVVFLTIWEIYRQKKSFKKIFLRLFPYYLFAGIFYYFYSYSLKFVTSHPNYQIHITNIKLLLNNIMWYFLWSLGVPNFMPDYMKSIFLPPVDEFWKIFMEFDVNIYFRFLMVYFILFFSFLVFFLIINKDLFKKILKYGFLSLIGFYSFLGPILFFQHKWMIRLTMPLIFLSVFQAYLTSLFFKKNIFFKYSAILLMVIYVILNYFGIRVHESSSLFLSESNVYKNMKNIVNNNKSKIESSGVIYFKGGDSRRIKNTLHEQKFLDHFEINKNVKAIFEFEDPIKKQNYFIIDSHKLLY